MAFAKIENSKRLQLFYRTLKRFGEMSTLTLCIKAKTCNAGTCASELRQNDIPVDCRYHDDQFRYKLADDQTRDDSEWLKS